MYFAHRLNVSDKVPYRSAMISDVPTQEASVPMILANSGIRYFSSGINNTRGFTFTQMYNQCPCWWEGPDGSRVLMMYVPGYAHASGWGLDQSVEQARTRIVGALGGYEQRSDYPYDAVFLHGAVSDNCLLNPRLAEVAKQWNERYEFPKIILCQNAEFFEHIEKNFADKLPVFRGSAGTYWEDGAGSSARETTLVRNAHEMVANGEKLLALAQRIKPETAYPSPVIEDAWRNCLLYDEHTWGAHCSVSQPESDFTKAQWKIKSQFAVDADLQSRQLLDQGSRALASLVKTDGRSLVVINPTSWPRTDILRVMLPEGTTVAEPGVVACDGHHGTYMLVKDVPACGYRVLKLAASGERVQPQSRRRNDHRKHACTEWRSIRDRRGDQRAGQGVRPRTGRREGSLPTQPVLVRGRRQGYADRRERSRAEAHDLVAGEGHPAATEAGHAGRNDGRRDFRRNDAQTHHHRDRLE